MDSSLDNISSATAVLDASGLDLWLHAFRRSDSRSDPLRHRSLAKVGYKIAPAWDLSPVALGLTQP